MENIMYVKWDTGHMNIVLQNFFPCSVAKFKKLLKVIALDWENCDRLIEDLKVYFQNQITVCGETAKQSAQDYSRLKTQVSDLEVMVKTRKKARGRVPDAAGIGESAGRFVQMPEANRRCSFQL